MCGIIGYTGKNDAIPKILAGLTVLEYRGYDSAGFAAQTEHGTITVKSCGRIAALEEKAKHECDGVHARCAIGHTRWATHGGVSERNAHPHTAERVTLVHNGIIENEKEWRAALEKEGITFLSETDTEVAAALFARAYAACEDPTAAIFQVLPLLRGSYAFAILFSDRPGEIYAVRKDSPLLLCRGEDGAYLASDLTALLPYSNTYAIPDEGVVARLCPEGDILLYSSPAVSFPPAYIRTDMQHSAAERGGYETFMKKEIHEQPQAFLAALNGREKNGLPCYESDGITDDFFDGVRRLHIVACGSAMHAGMLGAREIETRAALPVQVFVASEYRYHMPPPEEGTLLLLISQSGETADTLAALRAAKANGIPTLAIVNAPNTSIAREADRVLYTHAGPEVAVATTKGYSTQAALLFHLALYLSHRRRRQGADATRAALAHLTEEVPAAMARAMARDGEIHALAATLFGASHLFYIGRGYDFALATEGSLKLKEISYLHSEAYAAGELKHGTISLIEEGTPVIALSTDPALAEKTAGNVREVSSRGAQVLLLCTEETAPCFAEGCRALVLKEKGAAAVFAALVAMQLLAYETAKLRNCDIDRPRNLAKSVTVE